MRLHRSADAPAPRLLAPGLPDWIGSDGERLGWILRDRLFLLDGDGVEVVELPEYAEDCVATPMGWIVSLHNGFVRVDPRSCQLAAALVDDEADPVATRPGVDAALFVEVPEHRLLRLADGLPLPLPDAALRARWIRPWATGLGACWVDFDTLYRMGDRISALGKSPGTAAIACGPGGAVMTTIAADTVVAAPRGLTARLGKRLDVDGARFDGDGGHALALSPSGVALVDLHGARIVREWDGAYVPVGFLGDRPILWDEDSGAVVDGDGGTICDGFAGSAPSMARDRLAGPGGAAWRLSDGARVAEGLGGGACATDGERVIHVDDREIHLVGGPTWPHGLVGDDDDTVDDARIEGGALVVTTLDDEQAVFGLDDGALLERRAPNGKRRAPPRPSPAGVGLSIVDGESVVTVDGRRVPLAADGAAEGHGGTWIWTVEGMLAVV